MPKPKTIARLLVMTNKSCSCSLPFSLSICLSCSACISKNVTKFALHFDGLKATDSVCITLWPRICLFNVDLRFFSINVLFDCVCVRGYRAVFSLSLNLLYILFSGYSAHHYNKTKISLMMNRLLFVIESVWTEEEEKKSPKARLIGYNRIIRSKWHSQKTTITAAYASYHLYSLFDALMNNSFRPPNYQMPNRTMMIYALFESRWPVLRRHLTVLFVSSNDIITPLIDSLLLNRQPFECIFHSPFFTFQFVFFFIRFCFMLFFNAIGITIHVNK